MYSDFYGFTGPPFQPTLDPGGYFESESHRRALACLSRGLAQGEGFVVLTGAAGTGKTALVAQLLATLDRDRVTTASLVGGHLASGHLAEFLADGGQTIPAVARAFGLAAPPIAGLAAATHRPFMLDANLCFLRDEVRAGRRCLLVVDEAQALPIGALEALRLMSLFQLGDRPLLQIMLVGRPELRALLHGHPDLEQLRQRVVASHQLDPLEPGEVEGYIHHRLTSVGWSGNPGFAPQIHAEVHSATGGVPGRINQIVDKLLQLGAEGKKSHIDGTMLSQALAELSGHAPGEQHHPPAGPAPNTRLEAALARCEGQIAELQRAVIELADTRAGPAHHGHEDAALHERLGSLESRMIEQERTIRHTLTMLIEWIERDGAHDLVA